MITTCTLFSSSLYSVVGAVSLSMAVTNLFSKHYLPFQEEAAGVKWEELEGGLQEVIITQLRLIGTGFLISAIQLFSVALMQIVATQNRLNTLIPLYALLFIAALIRFNYKLHKQTGVNTPWKKSIVALLLVIAGMIFSWI